MGEATIVSKTRAAKAIDGVVIDGSAATDKIKVATAGYRTLRLRRACTGNVSLKVYGPKQDGTVGEEIASVAAGNDDFPDAIDIRGFTAVWVEATDTSTSENTVTIEAFLGT